MSCFRFIAAAARRRPVALSCRVLGVSRAGYYAWRGRPPSARARADAALTAVIHRLHGESRGVYGSPRIHADLRAGGRRHGRKRVARLMRAAGLRGCPRPRRRPRTTVADPAAAAAPNLVQRRLRPARRRTACGWPTSRTCPPRRAGCTWRPCWTPSAGEWWAGPWPTTCAPSWCSTPSSWPWPTRRPAAGLVHHSDRGCQYTVPGLRAAARRGRAGALDEPDGQLLGQRGGRELLRHPQAGAGRPPRPGAVAHPGGRPAGDLRLRRGASTTATGATRRSRYLSPAAYEAAHRATPAAAVA